MSGGKQPESPVAAAIGVLVGVLTKAPMLIAPVTKIVEALLKLEDPVVEAERQAQILAAKTAIRSPYTGTKAR